MNSSMWHALMLILLDFCKRPMDIPSIRFFHNLTGNFFTLGNIYIYIIRIKKEDKKYLVHPSLGKKTEVRK